MFSNVGKKVSKQLSSQSKGRQEGQGLVEYALILVLVAVVVIVVLLLLGPAVGNVFSEILEVFEGVGVVAESEDSGPEEGDYCVDYNNDGFGGTPWHYIWQYQSGSWVRVADPGGSMPTCSFSSTGPNGSR